MNDCFVIVEIKKIVQWKENVISRKWTTKQQFSPWKMVRRSEFIGENQLEIGNRGSIIFDNLFPTLYSETKQTYECGFGGWEKGA